VANDEVHELCARALGLEVVYGKGQRADSCVMPNSYLSPGSGIVLPMIRWHPTTDKAQCLRLMLLYPDEAVEALRAHKKEQMKGKSDKFMHRFCADIASMQERKESGNDPVNGRKRVARPPVAKPYIMHRAVA
jgi:hypothetical protein